VAGRTFLVSGDVAADIADAEAAILRLNAAPGALANTEAIARLLLRAEAVASSRVEGLKIRPRRLLRAEAVRHEGANIAHDVTAEEVLGNVDSMIAALEAADPVRPVTASTLLDIHRALLAGTHLSAHAGQPRTVQNWLGGNNYNPCDADFVPPPPEDVPALLEDLAAFCNLDTLPAVAQAAIAHAQFETIHPFVDGNGRAGRALVHLVLRRRGLAPHTVPPISLVLATRSKEYVAGLTSYRYEGDPDSTEAREGLNTWLSVFAGACVRAVAEAAEFNDRIAGIERTWRERMMPVRRNSSADLLLAMLPGTPVLTVNTAARMLRRSFRSANTAVGELVAAGILTQINLGRRNRAFEAGDVIDAFAELESQLAEADA
jgi:Fic family protein